MEYLNIIENESTKYYFVKEIYEFLNSIFYNNYNVYEYIDINNNQEISTKTTCECIDITKNFINTIKRNKKATLTNAKSVIVNNKKYYVNDVNKIIHDFNEIEVAEWIKNFLHKDIEYLPNISEDEKVKLGDYLIEKREIWELKTIIGNGKRTLDSAIKVKKGQASIFIFDITYSSISIQNAISQAKKIFKNRNWVEKIILKKNDKIIKVLIKNKKEIDYGSERN